jgi:antitoxin CptB
MQDLALLRKKLRHQCWYRGCKETDQVLGLYANARLDAMQEAELAAFASLLEEDDRDIWLWVSEQQPVPARHAKMIENIQAFHYQGRL